MHTYERYGVEFVEGSGARLVDSQGREYLDFLTGISVCSLGHCHPAVVEAITSQVDTLMHTSNLFLNRWTVELARTLSESSLGGPVFFCNSGAEANEAAIKIARKAAHDRGVEAPRIVVLEGGFHGRTMGAVSASPKLAADPSFAPYLEGFDVVGRDDPVGLAEAVGSETAAILIEPVQGEAGVYPISDEMLMAARAQADRVGACLIFDEVQCGMGRTGSIWAWQEVGVAPDLMTTAKALGGGYPVGACIAGDHWGKVLSPGDHGSTFAGGPVAARAALAAFRVTSEAELLASVDQAGKRLRNGLGEIDSIREVRGRGLMVAADLDGDNEAPEVVRRALDLGLVINATGPMTLRMLPPLIVSDEQVDQGLELISKALV